MESILSGLTEPQKLVALMAYEGLANKQIAHEMQTGEAAVKFHLTRVFRKLGVDGRVSLVRKLAPILGIILMAAVAHAQPKLSQVVTASSSTINLAGGGMNPAALQVSVTVPAGATVAPGPGLVAAGKSLAYFIPASGPAVLLIYGGTTAIPDGAVAVISLAAPFTPAMTLPLAVDANANTVGISISGGACDLNQDGSVTLADVQIAVDQATGKAACANDINADGKCTVLDVQRVVNAAAGGTCKAGA